MATWGPVVDGDLTVIGWTQEDAGSAPIFDQIDEGIAAADNTGIQATGSILSASFSLTASPADLADGSVTAVSFQFRHKQSGRVDDTLTWKARLQTSAVVILAADDSGGTSTTVGGDDPYRTTYGNNASVAFAYVATGATKAQWDDARVSLTFERITNMGADTVTFFVDTFDIVVTYTPTTTRVPKQLHLYPQLLAH